MDVRLLSEYGIREALRGMSYSYYDNRGNTDEWFDEAKEIRALSRARKLAGLGAGHNKFLRQVNVWLDINAPRYWWSEFDTYKVGTVAQSTSTMHKLAKVEPEVSDFSADTPMAIIECFKTIWNAHRNDIHILKSSLPEGYLQRRVVTLNYQTLRTIIEQRHDHRLREWQEFIGQTQSQLAFPELLY